MAEKNRWHKYLVLAMILSYAIAITSLINALFSLFLKGGEHLSRALMVSFCFFTAGTLFYSSIKRLR